MNVTAAITRLARMDAREIGFRVRTGIDSAASRLRYAVARPAWNRRGLDRRLDTRDGRIADAADALRKGDARVAHEILRGHFLSRASTWCIGAARRAEFSGAVIAAFPEAAGEARARAEELLAGRYDLLGYRALPCGRLPDWHADVVHARRAPEAFWADVAYLDPRFGDHKVIWELNRHQHWRALGRAWWLDGDVLWPGLFLDQLTSWLHQNPPLHGINWGSMLELAFRAISWTWALEFFANTPPDAEAGRPWIVDLLIGIDRQLALVSRNLSRYFSPNTHLSGEALALYVVSLALPELAASRERVTLGRDILLQESSRQILPDGGHAERSTHYHRYSTDFYLLATLAARRSGDPAAAAFADVSSAQAAWLRTMADDSGLLQPIGDDDGGQLFGICGGHPADVRATLALAAQVLDDPSLAVSAPDEEVWWILGRPPGSGGGEHTPAAAAWPSRLLPDTGYFVVRDPAASLIFDVGTHGYLNGGHAHADALSVVANVAGGPLFIDPGTGTYTMDAGLRNRLRSSKLHNTVVVDEREHAEPRGPFHWRSTTDASLVFAEHGNGCDAAQAFHDGYGDVRHARTCLAVRGIGWLIVDQLIGSGSHRSDLYWHIHPDWRIEPQGDAVHMQHADGPEVALAVTPGALTVIREGPLAAYAPEYGRILEAPLIRASSAGALPRAHATFVALPAVGRVRVQLALVPITEPAPTGWNAVGVDVRCDAGRITAVVAAPAGAPRPWIAARWGSDVLTTDGRVAMRFSSRGRAVRQLVVEGVHAGDEAELASAVHGGRA